MSAHRAPALVVKEEDSNVTSRRDGFCSYTTVHIGMPARLRDVDIPKAELPLLAQDTLKNFNANPGDRPDDYSARMLRLLEAAW